MSSSSLFFEALLLSLSPLAARRCNGNGRFPTLAVVLRRFKSAFAFDAPNECVACDGVIIAFFSFARERKVGVLCVALFLWRKRERERERVFVCVCVSCFSINKCSHSVYMYTGDAFSLSLSLLCS